MNVSTPSRKAATAVAKAATAVSKPQPSTSDKAATLIENERQAPAVTIQDIRDWMIEADKKLELAYDAAEPGAFVETLLRHICQSVIVAPLHTIQRDDITQADAARVYDELFPLLACIEGAIHLGQDSILSPTLDAVFELLDAAQTALDPVNDAVKALPAECEHPKSGAFEAAGIERDAYCMAGEAIAIIQSRLEDVNSRVLYGALRAVEYAYGKLSAGVDARDMGLCEDASAPFDAAIGVLELTLREHDDVALYGALRLLDLAKTSLDDAIAGAA